MDPFNVERTSECHVLAMPHPSRGHINSMMNLCKLISSKSEGILITFVLTEEWLSIIGSETKPDNIRFVSIPNVVPYELVLAADTGAFLEAVFTKMETPFERLLDGLEPPPTTIIADTLLSWAVGVGNRRDIPVVSLWPMSAMVFSMLYHFDLLVQNRDFPFDLSESNNKQVDYIPGISSTHITDFPMVMNEKERDILHQLLQIFPWVAKAQFLLITSVYELEAQAFDALRAKFSFPVYPVGPAIPYFKLGDNSSITISHNDPSYLQWLDSQPNSSVLYVSFGSYLSVSSAQMDEIVVGLRESGVQFLLVARQETSRLKEICCNMGLVVPWCDQLRVLSHSSIGGFWTHCGWNSIQEGVFMGVPFLTFPISYDQVPNSKLIVEDWKIGRGVKREGNQEILVKGEDIARVVQRFMDLESEVGKEMRGRARELQEICRRAIKNGGCSETSLMNFIRDILK